MLAQPFVTVLAAPPHMRGPMLPILPDSCFPGYRTGAFGAPEYSERSTAKVSSDFHVRFDNAYYSVDKAYLHKKVVIRASQTQVRIFSLEGDLIAEWPRAHHRGEWKTNPDHLPKNYKDFSEWNSTYFIRKASTVGPHTTELIKRILKSRKLEVQTYRLCIGVLGFTKKYSRTSLEECCRRALAAERAT